jgi:putative tryptophan/tyrosine transport system substrate-binding protein
MRRRNFIAGLSSTTAAWPVTARAQQPDRVRRLGVMTDTAENNPEGQARVAALRQRLQELGWIEGRNLKVDYRWSEANIEHARAYAAEIVALSPDVIFALANSQLAPLSRETRTIPIVFVGVSDPVGPGYVASITHPGGNITGFTLYEPSMGGKWVELLKEMAPTLARVENCWWAREDSNLQPSGYEPLALTIELRARRQRARCATRDRAERTPAT